MPQVPQQVVPLEIIDNPKTPDVLETNTLTQATYRSNTDQHTLISINLNGMNIEISNTASSDQIKAVFAALGEALC